MLTWERVEQSTQAVINSERGWEATTSTEMAPKIVRAYNNYDELLLRLKEVTAALMALDAGHKIPVSVKQDFVERIERANEAIKEAEAT